MNYSYILYTERIRRLYELCLFTELNIMVRGYNVRCNTYSWILKVSEQ
jgi:hypothetical protein